MRIEIDMDDELVLKLVYQELVRAREEFEDLLEQDQPNMFINEVVYDKLLIEQHIIALDILIAWYKTP